MAIGETTYKYLTPMAKSQEIFPKNNVNLKGYDQPTLIYGVTFTELETFLAINQMPKPILSVKRILRWSYHLDLRGDYRKP
ncbi:MAG: hypothetical protein RLZZ148_2495 [Cyanobacteriota bacterium]